MRNSDESRMSDCSRLFGRADQEDYFLQKFKPESRMRNSDEISSVKPPCQKVGWEIRMSDSKRYFGRPVGAGFLLWKYKPESRTLFDRFSGKFSDFRVSDNWIGTVRFSWFKFMVFPLWSANRTNFLKKYGIFCRVTAKRAIIPIIPSAFGLIYIYFHFIFC